MSINNFPAKWNILVRKISVRTCWGGGIGTERGRGVSSSGVGNGVIVGGVSAGEGVSSTGVGNGVNGGGITLEEEFLAQGSAEEYLK